MKLSTAVVGKDTRLHGSAGTAARPLSRIRRPRREGRKRKGKRRPRDPASFQARFPDPLLFRLACAASVATDRRRHGGQDLATQCLSLLIRMVGNAAEPATTTRILCGGETAREISCIPAGSIQRRRRSVPARRGTRRRQRSSDTAAQQIDTAEP